MTRRSSFTPSQIAEAIKDSDARFGNRRVPKMYAQVNALRMLIATEGTPRIQAAWDKIEEHLDFAYQMAAKEPLFDATMHFADCLGNALCNGGTPAYDPTLNVSEAAHRLWEIAKPEEHVKASVAFPNGIF